MTADEFAAVEQARALLARPAQASVLRARAFPSGMRMLLRVAAGDEAALRLAAERTGDSTAALHEACIFYVQQLMLDEASDSYRILGVDASAPVADIKAHYGLLMRWMHPDRNPDAWEVVFAERVNRAWNDLRTVDRRSAYDKLPAPGVEPDMGVEDWTPQAAPFRPGPAPIAHLHPSAVAPGRGVATPPSNPVAGRWIGAVAVAGLAAMVLFVAWPPPQAGDGPDSARVAGIQTPERAERENAPASEAARTTASPSAEPSAPEARKQPRVAPTQVHITPSEPVRRAVAAAPIVMAVRTPVQKVSQAPETRAVREAGAGAVDSDRSSAATVEVDTRPQVLERSTAPQVVIEETAALVASASTTPDSRPPAPPPTGIAAGDPGEAERLVETATALAQPSRAPDLDQASLLIGRFAYAYQKGDTAALSALFTADATSQGGGIDQIRAAYDRQFARTSERSISIKDIKWKVKDERALATGRFEIFQAAPGKQDKNSVSRGTIRFDIEQHQDRVLISRLEHIERGL